MEKNQQKICNDIEKPTDIVEECIKLKNEVTNLVNNLNGVYSEISSLKKQMAMLTKSNNENVENSIELPEEKVLLPELRKFGNENLDSVKSILKGNRDRVRSLKLKPGDMQLFKGRYSLHRVTRVQEYKSNHRPSKLYQPSQDDEPS